MSRADKHEIYRQAELGGRVGFGEYPAVVVVDFQRAFADPSVPGGGDFSEAIEATASLLDRARLAELPIFYTVVAYDAGLHEAGRFIDKCPTLRYCLEGTDLVELDERLGRRANEPVIVKKYASAFFGTTLASLLTSSGVDTVIICGCTTSGCVRASAIDTIQNGFRAVVPRECVADIAPEPHQANLFDIDAKYADVVTLSDVVAHLTATASTTRPLERRFQSALTKAQGQADDEPVRHAGRKPPRCPS